MAMLLARICMLLLLLNEAKSSHSNNGTNHTLCSSGRDGLPGVPGRDGRDGLPGPAGPAGLPGFYGPRGSKGDTGEIGTKGQKGQSSAGVQGPVGPAGLPGLKGSRGDTGAVGAKGQKGQEGPPGPPASSGNGVTYTRWGKSTCRSGVSRVYAGKTGSSFHEQKGGAANYICMPNDPEYTLPYQSGVRGHSYVYGTEYEVPLVSGRSQHNAPCAVCYVPTMNTVIMIPAKTSCPSGWTREYYGYLMSEYISHLRTTYTCVDKDMESVPGSQNHIEGGHFYHVEAHCNGVSCPPYNNYKELNCVVCSK